MVYRSPETIKEVSKLTQQSEQKAVVQTPLELKDPDVGQDTTMQGPTPQQSPTSPLEGPSTAVYANPQRKRV